MDAVRYVETRFYPQETLKQISEARRAASERVAAGQQLLPIFAPPSVRIDLGKRREAVIRPMAAPESKEGTSAH